MPIGRILCIAVLAALPGCSNTQATQSRGLTLQARLLELSNAIKLKSEVLDTEFVLLNANRSSSVPGASGKDYKIFIRVRPSDIHLWTADKETWVTSFPKEHRWLQQIVPDPAISSEFEKAGYTTYFKAEQGYEYTLWASEKTGIILLRYVQN